MKSAGRNLIIMVRFQTNELLSIECSMVHSRVTFSARVVFPRLAQAIRSEPERELEKGEFFVFPAEIFETKLNKICNHNIVLLTR